jgi:hypothetical protein
MQQKLMFKRRHINTWYGAAFFLFAFFWLYYPGEYVLIANQDLRLFFVSKEHFFSFLDRPGGVLEYLGHFLTQFYRFRIPGALILAALLTASYFLAVEILSKSSRRRELLILAMMVPLILLGMHNFYPHQIQHSLGFFLAISFALLVPKDGRKERIFHALAVPLLYFLLGGFVWFYCALVLARHAGKRKLMPDLLFWVLAYPALLIFLSSVLFLIHSARELFLISLPLDQAYPIPWLPFIFAGWVILMVVLDSLEFNGIKVKHKWGVVIKIITLLSGAFLILNFTYNRKNAEFFQIEKLAVEEDWAGLLSYVDQHPSSNLFGTFYTNLALVNTGKLNSALFNYPQPYGRRGLSFNWEEKEEILKRGADFFWAIRFINEAHHWAFESMIVNGFTQRNLKMLIQTELARGHYRVAQKYIHLLERSLFHKKMAGDFQAILDHSVSMGEDSEIGPGVRLSFRNIFFTDGLDLEKNLRNLIANDPENQAAYDYLMALLLLEKRVDDIALLLPSYAAIHTGELPRLLEESLLIYKLLHRDETTPEMGISEQTRIRFDSYFKVLQSARDQNQAARILYPEYKSSFWFHMNFGTLPSP